MLKIQYYSNINPKSKHADMTFMFDSLPKAAPL